jgi:hypothetical protein
MQATFVSIAASMYCIMTRNKSISMRAMFLLAVFLLNTVTVFACAIEKDMGFNKGHQHSDLNHHHDTDRHPKHGSKKESCCGDAATRLITSDKLTQRIFDISQLSIPFILLTDITHPRSIVVSLPTNVPNVYFSRHCRSPIADIRIVIQSFQI